MRSHRRKRQLVTGSDGAERVVAVAELHDPMRVGIAAWR